MSPPQVSERIRTLPPYLFAEIDGIKQELRKRGVDVIDLSVGDPDLPTPPVIVERLAEAARDSANHRYPPYQGTEKFRRAVALWYGDRFGVKLDPDTEVLALIGSKEGIAHLPLAFLNPGDVALVPDPGYPVYATATQFAGGRVHTMKLTEANHYRPVLTDIPDEALSKAKVLFLNYPNNPTSAVADLRFFGDVAMFAQKHNLLVCHDAAYTEVVLGGYESPSFLQAKGAREVGLEFHSLSKTFNMTGWRVGFAVGHRDAIAALGKIKTNVDSGVFCAIQEAAVTALEHWKELRDRNSRIYDHRRDLVLEGLDRLKISHFPARSTFYIWCKVPAKETSREFCARILRDVGICLTPGVGFGQAGEGHFRIALTASEIRLQEAFARLERYLASK